ncbi:MAG: CE1 family esterase [Pirellulaceae bacterium]
MIAHLPDDLPPRRRAGLVVAVVVCFAIVSFMLGLRTSRYWPVPITVLDRSLAVDGEHREYRLVIPDARREGELTPVVFALHGALETTSEMAGYTGLDQLAAKYGFLLVYLQGRHSNWPPFIPADNPSFVLPDLRFFEAMRNEMVSKHRADPQRVYVVGVSQGGAMANLLTAKCSYLITATVCCCGWLPKPLGLEPLNTQYKCPMLFIVGSQDRQVSPAIVRSAHDAFAHDGHPVEWRIIDGFGHGWPRDEGINDDIWLFLSSHRLPDASLPQGG